MATVIDLCSRSNPSKYMIAVFNGNLTTHLPALSGEAEGSESVVQKLVHSATLALEEAAVPQASRAATLREAILQFQNLSLNCIGAKEHRGLLVAGASASICALAVEGVTRLPEVPGDSRMPVLPEVQGVIATSLESWCQVAGDTEVRIDIQKVIPHILHHFQVSL
mmetsp:Transcript_37600/g.58709  ORF Transcript_37600/g.58709 Transcript_37600/m.58709 type:complete len:166 (-) Transcript_37600:321-818(-)